MEENSEISRSSFSIYVTRIFYILLILIFIMLLAYFSYLLYIELPRNPEDLNVKLSEETNNETFNPVQTEVKQFHPNMKFNHNNISYQIDENCDLTKKQRMIEAFKIFSENINFITFQEVSNNPDIEVTCFNSDKPTSNIDIDPKKDFFIAGEGGAKEIIESGKYNIITNGSVLLFKYPENSLKCKYPNIEIHELLHVFGFDHSQDEDSIMSPYLTSCDQKLDISIINELKRLYLQENLPDLYFENIKAVKKGRYLDFNLTVKNKGLMNVNNVTISIFDNNELVETSSVGGIKYGAGVFIRIENLKLIRVNPKEILFKIDADNKIKELDKNNNIGKVTFSQ